MIRYRNNRKRMSFTRSWIFWSSDKPLSWDLCCQLDPWWLVRCWKLHAISFPLYSLPHTGGLCDPRLDFVTINSNIILRALDAWLSSYMFLHINSFLYVLTSWEFELQLDFQKLPDIESMISSSTAVGNKAHHFAVYRYIKFLKPSSYLSGFLYTGVDKQ